jgi:hypothetical protein
MTYIRPITHGGHCCGITHIYGFPDEGPNTKCSEVKYLEGEEWNQQLGLKVYPDGTGGYKAMLNYPSRANYINYSRPAETAGERLKAVIQTICTPYDWENRYKHNNGERYINRYAGIIEIVLTPRMNMTWEKFVTELGFKKVNEHMNSNSGNVLHVYHLNTGQDYDKDKGTFAYTKPGVPWAVEPTPEKTDPVAA